MRRPAGKIKSYLESRVTYEDTGYPELQPL